MEVVEVGNFLFEFWDIIRIIDVPGTPVVPKMSIILLVNSDRQS